MDEDKKIIDFLIQIISKKCKLQKDVYLIGIRRGLPVPRDYEDRKKAYIFDYSDEENLKIMKDEYEKKGGIYNFEEILDHIIRKHINKHKNIYFYPSSRKIIVPYIKKDDPFILRKSNFS